MDIGREIFWNVGQTARWIAYLLMVISFAIIVYGVKKRYAMWKIGKATPFSSPQPVGTDMGISSRAASSTDHPASPRSLSGTDAPAHFLGVPAPGHRHGPHRLSGRFSASPLRHYLSARQLLPDLLLYPRSCRVGRHRGYCHGPDTQVRHEARTGSTTKGRICSPSYGYSRSSSRGSSWKGLG